MKKYIISLVLIWISSVSVFAGGPCIHLDECHQAIYGISSKLIEKYPVPNVSSQEPDKNLLFDRWYKKLQGNTLVYDMPNGNIIREIPQGFNYITALSEQDGWVQINQSEWVASSSISGGGMVSDYTGVFLPEQTLNYPFGWILQDVYPTTLPGEIGVETPENLLKRYTLVNLFDKIEIDGKLWYQVGVNQWIHQYNIARYVPISKPAEVETDIWISLDLYEQILIAYEGDKPVFATLIATGLGRWPTREGTYNIYYRVARKHMSGGSVGDDYYFLEEVPWTMFFDEGRALHGAYWHNGFGFRRSHGCVNLSITDANWLYNWVAAYMGSDYTKADEVGPAVHVYSTGQYE